MYFFQISLIGQALLGVAYLFAPEYGGTWLILFALIYAVLTTLTLTPRNLWFGDNIISLHSAAVSRSEVALTFDDGPDPMVTPQVLSLLEEYHATASFFCIAERALEHADLIREIIQRGHSVENHTFSHPYSFAMWRSQRLENEVRLAQTTLTEITGFSPRFFRPPAGFANPFLAAVLKKLKLHRTTWTRRGFDTRHQLSESVLLRLKKGLKAGDIVMLHDGSSGTDLDSKEPIILQVLPHLLHEIRAKQLNPVSLPQAFSAVAHDSLGGSD